MTDEPKLDHEPQIDDKTLAFAARVFDCARHGTVDEMAGLLDHGLPPNMANDKGDSLLMLAAYNLNAPVAKLLLERGADPDLVNDNGQTPLLGVCFKGDLPLVELLLAHGAAVEGRPGADLGPLATATMFGKTDIVRVLLGKGADPLRKGPDGVTVADRAKAMGLAEIVAMVEARQGH